ncbi:MAG: acetyl-CoA C-acetyltransferase, partial [Arenibacterium sp.]
MANEVVIAGASRTPMGGFQGVFDGVEAAELGGCAIRAALADASAKRIDEVLMGCVLPAGQGQAPARQAGFAAGLGEEV